MKWIKRQPALNPETCIAITDTKIVMGLKSGELMVIDYIEEKLCYVFKEDSKDFLNNAVTCIDVHPKRNDLVVYGYERG